MKHKHTLKLYMSRWREQTCITQQFQQLYHNAICHYKRYLISRVFTAWGMIKGLFFWDVNPHAVDAIEQERVDKRRLQLFMKKRIACQLSIAWRHWLQAMLFARHTNIAILHHETHLLSRVLIY